jgi:acetyltransferase-like isoleucine patch superfamily enzyme
MKILLAFKKYIKFVLYKLYWNFILYYNKIDSGVNYITYGYPKISIAKTGNLKIGSNFSLNSNYASNLIGRQQKTIISVSESAELIIGNNVGISSTAIICTKNIRIGNNVKIGGNTCIYDTDFHSLVTEERTSIPEITKNVKKKPVIIHDNVFIGAHSTILKGVTIGKNSIIGACSVVSKNIPENEIWAGNPAVFIKKLNHD